MLKLDNIAMTLMGIIKRHQKFLFFLVGVFLFLPSLASAQENRSYQYDNINVQIQINKDSTFDVTERQTYNYQGEYHQGWRSISLNKISAITDIEVIDGATGQPLKESLRLNKMDPTSWGHFATYKENGFQIVEWYYNLKDTTHLWIIKYKVHGGLGFYKDHDEIYWNLFTDYSVPVFLTSAQVTLPQNNFTADQETAWLYWRISPNEPEQKTSQDPYVRKKAGGTYEFIVDAPIAPQGIATIAVGWPKGLIEQKAFWWDWFYLNWPYFLSLLIILVSIIYYGIYWYLTERYHKGRGTIVPQYEPPQNLRPAMAELIATEKISRRTWPATIVDLAVRGYVKISEEKSFSLLAKNILSLIVLAGVSIVFIFAFLQSPRISGFYDVFPMIIFVSILILIIISVIINIFKQDNVDYVITRQKDYLDDPNVHEFEKDFLSALLSSKGKFSTGQNRFNSQKSRALYMRMQRVEYSLYGETNLDTKAYQVGLTEKRSLSFSFAGLILLVMGFLAFIIGTRADVFFPLISPLASLIFSFLLLRLLIKYNPRLNKDGFILKEEWLGFKMYLEKAEKYRLQNLTPDLFEKYLPYAMIFGLEKKWAKNFDSLNMRAPDWYVSSAGGRVLLIRQLGVVASPLPPSRPHFLQVSPRPFPALGVGEVLVVVEGEAEPAAVEEVAAVEPVKRTIQTPRNW